jgi:hypothetical protein
MESNQPRLRLIDLISFILCMLIPASAHAEVQVEIYPPRIPELPEVRVREGQTVEAVCRIRSEPGFPATGKSHFAIY